MPVEICVLSVLSWPWFCCMENRVRLFSAVVAMRVMARSLAESGYREEGGEHGVDRRDDARRGGIGVLIDLKIGELLIHVDAVDAEGAGADVVLDAGLERGVRRGGAGDRRI